jgi:DNA polymerase III subunit delta'
MSFFSNVIIQDKVKSFFQNVLSNDRLAHAYLFYGKPGSGKTAFAFDLAKELNCSAEEKPCNNCPACVKINNGSHPDIKYVYPVSRADKDEKRAEFIKLKAQNPYKKLPVSGHLNIAIETIRDLKKEAKYAPFEASKRIFIISGIEYFSREAANSFLKLLEEPPENLVLILISNDYSSVLDTIRSRCQPVMFPVLTDEEIIAIVAKYQTETNDITTLIRINQNNVEEVFELLNNPADSTRSLIVEFLRSTASGNWLEINKISEAIVQTRDKNKALEFINMLILWLSDAFHYSVTGISENLINNDMQDVILKFSNHYAKIDYASLIGLLEKACTDIKMNLNISLIIMNLSIDIKNILHFKKSA